MDFSIEYHSGIYTLQCRQTLRGNIHQIWDFFSRPENLAEMTSGDLSFEITSPQLPGHTYTGEIITYSIRIFPFFTNFWVTEITLMDDEKLFIDEQRFGPYKMWHHEHHFTKLSETEVLMTDRVSYKLPLGLLGRLIAGKPVRKRLYKIFSQRYSYCAQRF